MRERKLLARDAFTVLAMVSQMDEHCGLIPITAAEIAERSGTQLAHIKSSLARLQKVKLLRRVKVEGEYLYLLSPWVWQIGTEKAVLRVMKLFKEA
jgi:DNA-binding IclR family transcriptional regulator